MNILDEQMLEDQRILLRAWRIPVRQIGVDVGAKGLSDEDIIRELHAIGQVTFFSLDRGFFRRELCHPAYCLVWLDVVKHEAATFVRRVLRHKRFRAKRQRMGIVLRVTHTQIQMWQRGTQRIEVIRWTP